MTATTTFAQKTFATFGALFATYLLIAVSVAPIA